MKTSLFGLASLFFALTAARAQPSPQLEMPVALPAELGGLKISIAPTFRRPDSSAIELHKGDPHINVVLQNVGDKPISLYEEWNSWGAFNLSLEISAIDGKPLEKPLVISKGMMVWLANLASTETLNVGAVAVREVRFHLPRQILDPTAPATNENMIAFGPFYADFPFPPANDSRTLTMRAVFRNADAKTKPVWSGQIASPLTQYRFFWNTK